MAMGDAGRITSIFVFVTITISHCSHKKKQHSLIIK